MHLREEIKARRSWSWLLDRGYNEVAIQEQFEWAAGVPRQQALQKRRRVTNDRVSLICSWNERLPAQTSGEYCDNTFQYCKVRRALNSASLHRPFLASEGREICEIFWFTGRKRTQARRMPPSEHTSACTAGTWLARLCTTSRKSKRTVGWRTFTCYTSSLVDLITCSKCNSVYVGETGQKLRERMNGHRADIKNKNTTPVGLHFNAKGHEPRISGLQKKQLRTQQRGESTRRSASNFWNRAKRTSAWTETRALTSSFCNSPILLIERCQQVLLVFSPHFTHSCTPSPYLTQLLSPSHMSPVTFCHSSTGSLCRIFLSLWYVHLFSLFPLTKPQGETLGKKRFSVTKN